MSETAAPPPTIAPDPDDLELRLKDAVAYLRSKGVMVSASLLKRWRKAGILRNGRGWTRVELREAWRQHVAKEPNKRAPTRGPNAKPKSDPKRSEQVQEGSDEAAEEQEDDDQEDEAEAEDAAPAETPAPAPAPTKQRDARDLNHPVKKKAGKKAAGKKSEKTEGGETSAPSSGETWGATVDRELD